MCRRYGAAWAYYTTDEVKLPTTTEALESTSRISQYSRREDATITFNFCTDCMCLMYWWPTERAEDPEKGNMGLNTRMMDPEVLRGVDQIISYEDLYR